MLRGAVGAVVASVLGTVLIVSVAANTGELTAATAPQGPPDGIPPVVSRLAVDPGDQVIAPPPEEFGAAPLPPAPPPVELRSPAFSGVVPQGGTWAVLIGINDYPGRGHDLRSAVNDARDVDAALAAYGVPASRRLLITDRQASAATIRRATEWLVAHAGPRATAVFFYAGHVRKLDSNTEAIVASDGGTVPDHELAGLLASLRAKRTWVAVAGCYGGGFTEVLAPGRVLTGAAPSNRLAYENSSFGRSYMVEYMVRRAMLGGQAPGSVEQSFAWASSELRRDFPNRMPVQYDHAHGDLRLGPRAASTAAPSADDTSDQTASSTDDHSSGSTGGSTGGTSSPPPSEPEERNSCGSLTLGIVRCGS